MWLSEPHGTLDDGAWFCNKPSSWSQCSSRNVTGFDVRGSKDSGIERPSSSSYFGQRCC